MTSRKKKVISANQESPPTHQQDPIVNLSEVARQLGKAQPTIRRWVNDGLLEGIRMPSGLIGVRQSQINQILEASTIHQRIGTNR